MKKAFLNYFVLVSMFAFQLANAESSCTDFSGKWKGSCKKLYPDGKVETSESKAFIFQSGCDDIAIDSPYEGGKYRISKVAVEKDHYYSDSRILDWNHDKTALKLIGVSLQGSSAAPDENDPYPETFRVQLMINGRMNIENDHLIFNVTYKSAVEDNVLVDKRDCTFSRER
jgi:hypothetical protein